MRAHEAEQRHRASLIAFGYSKAEQDCYHRWERRIYRKKLTKEGNVYGGGALNGTEIINVNQAIRMGFRPMQNDPNVAIAPIETPTRGYKS
jgi:hypothetical protein